MTIAGGQGDTCAATHPAHAVYDGDMPRLTDPCSPVPPRTSEATGDYTTHTSVDTSPMQVVCSATLRTLSPVSLRALVYLAPPSRRLDFKRLDA